MVLAVEGAPYVVAKLFRCVFLIYIYIHTVSNTVHMI